MALQLEQKRAIVAEVNQAAAGALSAVLADYRGLTVAELTELRQQARQSGVYLRVVRNTLLRRAVVGTAYECLGEAATGPTMLAFSNNEPGSAARLLKEAAGRLNDLDVKAVSIDGQVYSAEHIDRLASLPTRDEAIAKLMAVLRAPIAKLASTLSDVPGKLTRTVAAVRDLKERQPAVSADGPEPT